MQKKISRLRAPSIAALARFAAMLIVVTGWFVVVSAGARRYASPVPILLAAAIITALHALKARDGWLGPDLGRWDEVAGLTAAAGLVRCLERSASWSAW